MTVVRALLQQYQQQFQRFQDAVRSAHFYMRSYGSAVLYISFCTCSVQQLQQQERQRALAGPLSIV
jgi:hypothetical protein